MTLVSVQTGIVKHIVWGFCQSDISSSGKYPDFVEHFSFPSYSLPCGGFWLVAEIIAQTVSLGLIISQCLSLSSPGSAFQWARRTSQRCSEVLWGKSVTAYLSGKERRIGYCQFFVATSVWRKQAGKGGARNRASDKKGVQRSLHLVYR